MNWLQSLFHRRQLYRDLSDEIQEHLDEAQEALMQKGLSPQEAQDAARKRFGNVASIAETGRETWRWPALETFVMDLRYALRQLRKDRSFTIVAILILGLGIGATTAVYSVVDAVLIRPLPFREPERLVRVANDGESGLSSITSRSSNLADWKRMNASFEDLAGYFAFYDYQRFTLYGKGEPERLVGVGVTESFLPMLGVQPALGRQFVHEECLFQGRPAIILTHGFWERRFASDSSIVGQALTLNNTNYSVVGVLPATFDFASVFVPGSRIDFLLPFPVSRETDRQGNTLAVFGRLKPGVTIANAQAELDVINKQLQDADPNRWGLGAVVSELRGQLTGSYRDALALLALAVGLVLLIACTNLSSLLLSRAASRNKEIAIRSAIGAGRFRLVRQLLTEAFVLAAAGGVFGVALAVVLTRAVRATQAVTIPLLHSVRIDGEALLVALVLVMGCALLFGIAPALQLSGSKDADALRDSSRGLSEGQGRVRVRSALVVAEIALACVLLVSAGLLMRSFFTLLNVDLGFQPAQRVSWRVETNRRFETLTERARFYLRLIERVKEIPGVESAGLTDTLPLGRNREWGAGAKGVVYRENEAPSIYPRMVSPGYLDAMGIRIRKGRDFTTSDNADSRRVIIINQAAERAIFPGQDALGKILINNNEWLVVGVVDDVRHSSVEQNAGAEVYFPIMQMGDWGATDLVVRSTLPLAALNAPMRVALREMDSQMPVDEFQTLGAVVDRAVSPRRFVLYLLGAFAFTAVLLASLGIYGLISYSVSRRATEIGIRMALGASPQHVRKQILRHTLTLGFVGIILGTIGALIVSRLMASLLFGVSSTDVATFAGAIALLFLVAATAGFLPARRASRIEPRIALQEG